MRSYRTVIAPELDVRTERRRGCASDTEPVRLLNVRKDRRQTFD